MPEAWAKLLLNSGISAAEKKKNPQAVVKALEFYTTNQSGLSDGETKFMTAQRYGEGKEELYCIGVKGQPYDVTTGQRSTLHALYLYCSGTCTC